MITVFSNEKDERFLKLVEELDLGYYKRIGEDLNQYAEYNEFKTPHIVALLLDSGEAVACASYRIFNDDSVEFKRVFVKPDYRKRQIGYSLIKKLEDRAMEDNFKHSYIITGKNNTPAIRLYEKLNYYIIPKFGQFKDDERWFA